MKRRIVIEYIPCHWLSSAEIEEAMRLALEDSSEAIITNIKIEDFPEPKKIVPYKGLIKEGMVFGKNKTNSILYLITKSNTPNALDIDVFTRTRENATLKGVIVDCRTQKELLEFLASRNANYLGDLNKEFKLIYREGRNTILKYKGEKK